MKKVIIIGAGPAGLTAGYELLKDNKEEYEVIILEAENEVGGISKTIKYNGNRMDIGGHRFFSKDESVMKFWKDLMPLQGEPSFDDKILKRQKPLENGGPNPETEDNVMLVRDRVSRIYYLKKFFDYPVSLKWETFKNMGFLRTMKAGFSYLKSIFVKKEETSLENFYINRFGKELYGMFFEKYTEKLWGRHPSEIAADWGAQRVKGLSITAVIKDMFSKIFGKKNKENTETSLIEQFWYPKYGPGELWEVLAKEIENLGGKILKNYEVQKINLEENKIKSVECMVDGKFDVISGDIFISSMPLKDLVESIKDDSKVPDNIRKIATGLPYRDFMTVGLYLKKLDLKNKTPIKTLGNIVPDCWIYVQEPDVKLGRIQIFNNWSPYLVENPEERVWIGLEYFCDEGDKYWNMSDKDFINFAIDELVSMGIIEKSDVLDSHREKIKKAYPAYFDTYSEIDKLIEYLNMYDNLYCIGRNGQHRYNNMDHSMVTAIEAVKNIKGNIKSRDNIWNVNTDKEYHEVKSENMEKNI
ncbi:MAG: NAD(P)/FAD-dependent oxidoreductase [Clostridia bacterium]|nr:NAD(P)/FAD-dependent oxidoreductase [Clostridia bacterium]